MKQQIKKWLIISYLLTLMYHSILIILRLPDRLQYLHSNRWLGAFLLGGLSIAIIFSLYKVRKYVLLSSYKRWYKIIDWIFWMNAVGAPVLLILFIVRRT